MPVTQPDRACGTRSVFGVTDGSAASSVLDGADDSLYAHPAPVRGARPSSRSLTVPTAIANGLSGRRRIGMTPIAASSYPLLNVFWSMLYFFLWIIWIWILITVFIDIFRSHDLSGWGKALWFLFVLFIPLVGVLVYLIARGGKMQEHATQDAQQQDQEFKQYVQQAVASSPASTADQLSKLADLRDRGVISADEFEREKAKVLAS